MIAQQVHLCAAGEGDELATPDATVTVKVDARHTAGGYELFEVDAPRGPATPPHRTPWSKAYYLLHGRLLVQVEDRGYDLAPGGSITIPPHALHTFTVLTPSARFLTVSLSGAMGEFFADLDRSVPTDRPPADVAAALRAVAERHHVVVPEPTR